jgi:hypothetical protein
MGALMTVAELLKTTVDQVNTPYTDHGAGIYHENITALIYAIDGDGPGEWDEVYEGDRIVGFDIGDVRITLREDR